MDKVFVDTNVLLDYLAARPPFDKDAETLMQHAEFGQIEMYVSVLSFCNIAYILRKLSPGSDVIQALTDLSKLVSLTPIDDAVVSDALQSSFKDFEDAVQHFSALHYGGISWFITRNTADFVLSQIPVCTPKVYLLANP